MNGRGNELGRVEYVFPGGRRDTVLLPNSADGYYPWMDNLHNLIWRGSPQDFYNVEVFWSEDSTFRGLSLSLISLELQKSISKVYIILLQSNHPHLLSLITASHKSHFHFLFSNVRLSLSSFDNPSAKMAVQSKTN